MARTERLARHAPLCVMCLAVGRVTEVAEWDHIVALADGGADHESNMQGLCLVCHALKTRHEARARIAQRRTLTLSNRAKEIDTMTQQQQQNQPGQNQPGQNQPGQNQPGQQTPPGQDPNRVPPGQDPNRTPPGQDPNRNPPGQSGSASGSKPTDLDDDDDHDDERG